MNRTHGVDHWDPDGCDGCRYHTVAISAAATPTRRPHEAASLATEARWHKDHAAYRRLTRDGIQPAHIDGAHRVEAEATSREQAEHMDRRPAWTGEP